MKKRLFMGLLAFFALSLLCLTTFSSSAEAKPHIVYHVEHVYLYSPGEATIEGYFVNEGDTDGYAKWVDLDLTLIADNGQEMWSDSGIRHYLDIRVPAYEYVDYTYYVQNSDLPEYYGKVGFRSHTNTHWSTGAG